MKIEVEVGVHIGCRDFHCQLPPRVSVPRNIHGCVFGCKRVSESHCEAPGIYNYPCRGIIPTRLRSKQTRGREAKEREG